MVGEGGGLMGGLIYVTERSYGPAPISKAESLVGGGRGGGGTAIYGLFKSDFL